MDLGTDPNGVQEKAKKRKKRIQMGRRAQTEESEGAEEEAGSQVLVRLHYGTLRFLSVTEKPQTFTSTTQHRKTQRSPQTRLSLT